MPRNSRLRCRVSHANETTQPMRLSVSPGTDAACGFLLRDQVRGLGGHGAGLRASSSGRNPSPHEVADCRRIIRLLGVATYTSGSFANNSQSALGIVQQTEGGRVNRQGEQGTSKGGCLGWLLRLPCALE